MTDLVPGFNELAYLGVNAANPPDVIVATRAPTTLDTNHALGTVWVYRVAGSIYILANVAGGVATWAIVGGGSSDVNTINSLPPTAGNIVIAGTANQIGVNNSGSTVTLSSIGPYTPATYTAHGVLMGEGTSSIAASSAGTSGQVFTSGGASADGAYQNMGVNSGLTGIILGNGASAFTTTNFTAAGSFTPAFSLATPGDSAWTYTSQLGRFTRIGSMIFFVAELVWTNFANTTGSGNWQLNLPVTSGAFARTGHVHISGSGVNAGAETANLPSNFVGEVGNAQNIVVLSVEEGGVGNAANALFNLTVTQVKTSGTMTVTGMYFAA